MGLFGFFKRKKSLKEIADELARYCLADIKAVGGFNDITAGLPRGKSNRLFLEYLRLRITIVGSTLDTVLAGDDVKRRSMYILLVDRYTEYALILLGSKKAVDHLFSFPPEIINTYYDILDSGYDGNKMSMEFAVALFKFAGMDIRTNKEDLEKIEGFVEVYCKARMFVFPELCLLMKFTKDLLK